MGRFIVFVLLAVGAFYLYQNQDEILTNAKELFLKEKTISKVNNASAEKQKAIEEAMDQVLGY